VRATRVARGEGAAFVALCVALAAIDCGGGRHAPAAPVPAPVASATTGPSASAPPIAEDAAPPLAVPSLPEPPAEPSASPPPLPATAKLARGAGTPGDTALAAGDAAYDADDFVKAEEKYREAAKLLPKDAAPLVGLARVGIAKTNLATDYNVAPKHPALDKAVQQLRQAIKLDAKFAPAHIELGRALLMLGKAPDALSALRKAVDLAPDDAEAHSALGVADLATGHADEALAELARAADLDPGSAPRQTNLGTALFMRGRVAEALKAYELASRIAPNDPRTLSDLGTALLAENQIDRAISVLRSAVKLDPKRAALHSNLGYALQQKRDLHGAIVAYRVELDEKLVSAWINLATALVLTGDRPGAHKALERAEKLDPSDPRVRANLDELRDLEKKYPLGAEGRRDGGR